MDWVSTAKRSERELQSEFSRYLIEGGLITPSSLDRASQLLTGSALRLDQILVQLGLLDDRVYTKAWAAVLGWPYLEAIELPSISVLPELLPVRFLRSVGVVPVASDGTSITIAISDPLDQFASSAIAARTSRIVRCSLAPASLLRETLDLLDPATALLDQASSSASGRWALDVTRLQESAADAPAIQFVHNLIGRAVELKASDIHLATGRNKTRLRYRIDGVLNDDAPPAAPIYDAVISRIKVLAELDIAERRRPQDGRIRYDVAGKEIDLRVATMPHIDGEGVVLRILDRSAVKPELSSLGFSREIETGITDLIANPHGIFLVTGPTGSGKTTTLYAILKRLIRPDRNILSVEDPVEYHLEGVSQIQVQRKIGLDFPSILRATLRSDPDVIMVGEIRDPETAAIANQAALTGHFVLATLHTNSAAASIPRLVDMGVEPYLLASTLRGALSQRLIRCLCNKCAAKGNPGTPSVAILQRLAASYETSLDIDRLRQPVGCSVCSGTGYRFRVAVGELIAIDDSLRSGILERADTSRLEQLSQPHASLSHAAAALVFDGHTSLDEFMRVMGGSVAA